MASKDKEIQHLHASLETLTGQLSQTRMEQSDAQRARDLCKYQLEQIISSLKKHKSVYLEVVNEIDHDKLPAFVSLADISVDSI